MTQKAAKSPKIHVLDANVFIHGAGRPLDAFDNPVTVPAVTAELESRDAGLRFDVTQVAVYEPGESAVRAVEEQVEQLNEDLSAADVQVVALALDRDGVVVSDDYGVQNVASALNVPFQGVFKDEIDDEISWVWRCTNCGETFGEQVEKCTVCGGATKRVRE